MDFKDHYIDELVVQTSASLMSEATHSHPQSVAICWL